MILRMMLTVVIVQSPLQYTLIATQPAIIELQKNHQEVLAVLI